MPKSPADCFIPLLHKMLMVTMIMWLFSSYYLFESQLLRQWTDIGIFIRMFLLFLTLFKFHRSLCFCCCNLELFNSVTDLFTFTVNWLYIFFPFFSQYHGSSGRLLIRFFIFDVFLKSFCSGENVWQVTWQHFFPSSLHEDFPTLTSLASRLARNVLFRRKKLGNSRN